MIPPHIRAAFQMLAVGQASACPYDVDWNALLAFTDRFQLTLYLRHVDGLPAHIQDQIQLRRAKNLSKRGRLRTAYYEVAEILTTAGIEFLLLKGFTHQNVFGISPEDRVQYDLDILCRPEDRESATRALFEAGYRSHGERSLSAEHSRPLVKPSEWKWRGDYFDPDVPISIELHDSLWHPAHDRILVDMPQVWRHKTVLKINCLTIPALSEIDRIRFASLHVLRHVLRNDARPAHAFELACVSIPPQNPDLLELCGFRFAAAWFGSPVVLPGLPPKIDAWFNQFAWSPIENLITPNKDAIWLHLMLLEKWYDRAAVLRRRLTPFRLPHQHAGFFERLGYHAAALARALLSGFRWRRSYTTSTASQISAWNRPRV
ncbi:MAG: nucleotidyltransferase family protein [Bryobacterales bacterium]|nr:nucleotidyltransferase family protein [Bryobacterales bacterium]MBV9398237.1 nucleotidyltransferase family protein [Bryobacterales bacterium]